MAKGQQEAVRPSRTNSHKVNGEAGVGLRIPSGLAVNGKKNGLHSMDPDEIFSKYTVHEVKTVLNKLR